MTMLAHSVKGILNLVPEAKDFIKQASLEEEFPLDNKDSCIATALQLEYFKNIDYNAVDFSTLEKVAQAVHLYGVSNTVKNLSNKMIKTASAKREYELTHTKESYLLKEAAYVGDLPSIPVSARGHTAQVLYKEAQEFKVTPHDSIMLYSGNGSLDKMAAVKSLSVRYNETKNDEFVKLARIIADADSRINEPENFVKVASYIARLDEKMGLHFGGFNFFQESLHIKAAAFKSSLSVKVSGQAVPYEKIEGLGKQTISKYLGADVAKEMDHGPENFKAVLETLPNDMQRLLLDLTKNV